jgi:hypothetical protein
MPPACPAQCLRRSSARGTPRRLRARSSIRTGRDENTRKVKALSSYTQQVPAEHAICKMSCERLDVSPCRSLPPCSAPVYGTVERTER